MLKRSWRNRLPTIAASAVSCCSLLYPAIVYFATGELPAAPFVALAIALLALMAFVPGALNDQTWRRGMAAGGVLLVALAAINTPLAARAYPVVLSVCAAAAFGGSLFHTQSMIERFATLRGGPLSDEGRAYCRNVTIVWTIWLCANATIAAGLALWASDAAWALWTGLLSYIVMALLLGGEWLVRPRPYPNAAAR